MTATKHPSHSIRVHDLPSSVLISLRIYKPELDRLDKVAKARKRTRSNLLRILIERGLELEETTPHA